MAWTELDSTPGNSYGSAVYFASDAAIRARLAPPFVYATSSHLAWSPGVDVGRFLGSKGPLGFPSKFNTGWINYSEGGGGGSTRPSTGMLYPRYN